MSSQYCVQIQVSQWHDEMLSRKWLKKLRKRTSKPGKVTAYYEVCNDSDSDGTLKIVSSRSNFILEAEAQKCEVFFFFF